MNDVLALLAEANPVRLEDVTPLDLPDLERPRRRLALAAVAAAAIALTAALLAVFVFSGSPSRRPGHAGFQLLPSPTLAHPLPTGAAKRTSLAEAGHELGAPLVLPDSSLAAPSGVGAVWSGSLLREKRAAVTFPSSGLIVLYWHPALYANPPAIFAGVVKGNPGFHLLDLGGVAALAIDQDSDSTGANFGSVEFDAGGTTIAVLGHYGQQALEAVAQSIVDQSRPTSVNAGVGWPPTLDHPLGPLEKPITLADVPSTLGAPIVLPDCVVVHPSDAGAVWGAGDPNTSSAIAVTFPTQGLIVLYKRPPISDPQTNFENFAEQTRGTSVIDLNGTPALAIAQAPDGSNWGSVEFVANGMTIVVMGHNGTATLQTVAQSIIDRSK